MHARPAPHPSALGRPERHLPDPRGVAIAIVAVVLAMGGRAMLEPWLRESAAFLFAWPAVVVVALTAGRAAATSVAVLCVAWAASRSVPPIETSPLALGLFLATAVALAWAVPWLARLGGGAAPAAAAPAPPGATVHHRVVAALRWIVLLAAVVPLLALLGIGAWQLRVRSDEAHARLERVTRLAAEHATRVLETHETLLRRVADLLAGEDDARLAAAEPALRARLRSMTAGLSLVRSIGAHDAAGRALLEDRLRPAPAAPDVPDVPDRECFAWHREGHGGLCVTGASGTPAGDGTSVELSLRRVRPDGSFGGLVSVGLEVGVLAGVHHELALELPGATFALLRADGRWISRPPGPTPAEAAAPPGDVLRVAMREGVTSGRLALRSPVDRALRQVAFHHVAGYPVYAIADVGRGDVLARWRGDMALISAILVPLTAVLVVLAWIALRRAEQGLASVERLQSETAQRLRAEAALRQSQKLETLGRLTGGVAHDFNNLLTIVGNNVHLLRRLAPRDADSPQLAAIERAVRTGSQLTRQLLAFSRRQVVRVETIRLQDRLPELLVLVRPLLPPGIEVEVDVAPDTAGIEVDGAEFELAVLNLVGNARDAMPDGGRVRLSARDATPAESEGLRAPLVAVAVEDSGSGIAPELLPRVFEPFFSTKPHGEGTGLGLAQVMALCRSAGGIARLRSEPGRGTTVTMLFAAADGARTDAAGEAPAGPLRPLGLRVLLVEDNPDVAVATCELLETMGCTVRRVADADAAVDTLASPPAGPGDVPFDVVLSDIAMPGSRDGIALGAWIRAHRPAIGVVLMTGYAERLGKAAEQGLVVLPKPCPPAALAQALREARPLPRGRTGRTVATAQPSRPGVPQRGGVTIGQPRRAHSDMPPST